MRLDGRVDPVHEPDRLPQRPHHAPVVAQVVVVQLPPLAVFQPLLADLIPDNVELSDLQRHALEILALVDQHHSLAAVRPAFRSFVA